MKRAYLVLLVLLLAAAGSSGCAAVGLTLVGVGASTGSSYIMDSIYHKTFAASEEGLRAATLKTLKRMDITVTEEEATESGRTIVASAGGGRRRQAARVLRGPRPRRGDHHPDRVDAPRRADARTQDESDGRRRAQAARSRDQVRRGAASGGNQDA